MIQDQGWPTAEAYVAWARAQGCTVASETIARGGEPLHAVSLTAPSGKRAVEIVLEMTDPLMSTTIARLDRRLGLKSYLFR